MTTLDEVLDCDLLRQMLEDGYIRMQRHPDCPELVIYNYSEKAVFEKVWNEVTLQCRGMIVNESTNVVVARGFNKFFNLSEMGLEWNTPSGNIWVQEKVDGSLGISYRIGEEWRVATRGSFASEQALKATEILHRQYPGWKPCCDNVSYLWEIIYPSNRIVVDYQGLEDLVLLDVVHNATGNSTGCAVDPNWNGPEVKTYPYRTLTEVLDAPQASNAEGFVVSWEDGTRVKIKFEEYVRAHAIVTNTSSVTIWRYLSAGLSLEDLFVFVPDEFKTWVEDVAENIEGNFDMHCDFVVQALWDTKDSLDDVHHHDWNRKDFAKAVAEHPYRAELFLALDDKDFSGLIWKRVRPERELPFKEIQ